MGKSLRETEVLQHANEAKHQSICSDTTSSLTGCLTSKLPTIENLSIKMGISIITIDVIIATESRPPYLFSSNSRITFDSGI